MKAKIYTCEAIAEKLNTDNNWLVRGLLAIYDRQTADEKTTQETKHVNGVGFNGADAKILSSFAQWYRRTGRLSEKQLGVARRKMQKYAGQLARIANGEV